MTVINSTLLTVGQLATRLNDPDWIVFDCRFDLGDTSKGRRDYATNHIPGARYAHLDEDLAGKLAPGSGRHPLPDPHAFIRWLRTQGVTNASQVVVYDDGAGAIAARLWWMLRHWLGHAATAVLDGGWNAWQAAELSTEVTVQPATAGDFAATPDPLQIIETEALVDTLAAGDTILMDARLPPRYRGEIEPLDPVAGHVPGAINLPFMAHLDADGRFAEVHQLRSLYDNALGGHDAKDMIVMCGSGVTACHNILAMDIAGMHGAKLYVGSWSAWCSDPLRPVATGG